MTVQKMIESFLLENVESYKGDIFVLDYIEAISRFE